LDLAEHPARSTPIVWLALLAAIVCGVMLRLSHQDDVSSRSPDEKVYTYRAQQVADQGLSAMRPWFPEYVNSNTTGELPPPTRVGYVAVSALAMKLMGVRDFRAGAAVSLLCSVLSLLLLAWIGVRFFNPWVAAGAVSFLAFSVAELGMARRAWVDGYFGFIGLLLLYLTLELMRTPRRVFLYPLFFLSGTCAILSKETSVFVYGICGLWLFGFLVWKERWGKGAALLALGGLLSVAAALGTWSLLAGNLTVPLSALTSVKVNTDWGRLNTGGPWYQFTYLLWLVGPLTGTMALVGIIAAALPSGIRSKAGLEVSKLGIDDLPGARLAASVVVSLLVFVSFVGHLQYLRMTSPADGAYCLLAGLGLWNLLTLARRFLPITDYRALVLVAVLAVGIEGLRDYRIYTDVVVRTGMEDLTAIWIRTALGR